MPTKSDPRFNHAILFDLDDTLVDSGGIKRRVFREALEKCSIEEDSLVDDFMRLSGTPLFELCDSLELPRDVPITYRELSAKVIGEIEVFPNICAVLEFFSGREIPLGIVTGRDRQNSLLILETTSLNRFFHALVTPDDINSSKPLPGPLFYACGLLNSTPSASIYVGDAAADMQSAKAAGMIGVGSTWSGNSARDLLHAGATTVAPTVVELKDTLLGLLDRRQQGWARECD